MQILSLDLSLSSPAFAVMEVEEGKINILHLSHLKTNTKKTRHYRLYQIYNHIKEIILEYPDIQEVVREKGFSRFPSVTQILFRVVGVSDIALYKYGGFEDVTEIPPTTVKKAITGNGRASKDVVAEALSTNFDINNNFKTDDESDAVGVGITHFIQKKLIKSD